MVRRLDVMSLKLVPVSAWVWKFFTDELTQDEFVACIWDWEEKNQASIRGTETIELPSYEELTRVLDKISSMTSNKFKEKIWALGNLTADLRRGYDLCNTL